MTENTETSPAAGNNNSVENNDGVPPPSEDQRRKQLDVTNSTQPVPHGKNSGDSDPIPKYKENILNDGIEDQRSRRSNRPLALIVAGFVLLIFLACISYALVFIINPIFQNLEEATKIVLTEPRTHANIKESSNNGNTKIGLKNPAPSSKEEKPNSQESTSESKSFLVGLYEGARNAIYPIIAIISILTIAIVIILITILRAVFSNHPNHDAHRKEKELENENSKQLPFPLTEFIKEFVEVIKSIWKK